LQLKGHQTVQTPQSLANKQNNFPNPKQTSITPLKMQFSTTFLAATAALFSTAFAADGILAINGTGTIGSPTTVTLQVLNGLVGDPATCYGTAETAPLPASGTIPCKDGYALSYTWDSVDGSIAATYTTPNPTNTFTYNVPNLGCSGEGPTCSFGFQDIFPGKKVRRALRA
jgi:hypothetical protein